MGSQQEQQPRAPLEGRYWFTVAFVLLALVPDLLLSTSLPLAQPIILKSLHTTRYAVVLGETFSNAGWAFGAVLASFLALRVAGYKLNLIYEAVFVVGSLVAFVGPTVPFYVAGRILQGTSTGMLLVSALPPLVRNFPVKRLTTTATFVDIGFFGAVVAGPIIGGYVAETDTWRWFFGTVMLLGFFGLILAYLVVQRSPGYNPTFPFDFPAVALAVAGAGLTFYGVSQIQEGGWTHPIVWMPTALGLICTLVLIIYQYVHQNALMPVKPLASTYPVMGIVAGIVGGLGFTALTTVVFLVLRAKGYSPLWIGLMFWPSLAASLLASVAFGYFFNKRYLVLLPLAGLLSLIVAAWLLTTTTATGSDVGLYLWVTGFLGVGAGLSVSPGLFMAGLAVEPPILGRAFALVELLRLAGAYAFVPAFEYFAMIYGMRPQKIILGAHIDYWVVMVGLVLVTVLVTAVFFIGGARIHAPDLVAYLEHDEVALISPPVFAGGHPRPSETLRDATRSALGFEDGREQMRRQHEGDGRENQDIDKRSQERRPAQAGASQPPQPPSVVSDTPQGQQSPSKHDQPRSPAARK